jgi:hypothetical protein
LLGKERKEEEEDPYTKWRMRFSKSVSILDESTMRKLDKLEDNERRKGIHLQG